MEVLKSALSYNLKTKLLENGCFYLEQLLNGNEFLLSCGNKDYFKSDLIKKHLDYETFEYIVDCPVGIKHIQLSYDYKNEVDKLFRFLDTEEFKLSINLYYLHIDHSMCSRLFAKKIYTVGELIQYSIEDIWNIVHLETSVYSKTRSDFIDYNEIITKINNLGFKFKNQDSSLPIEIRTLKDKYQKIIINKKPYWEYDLFTAAYRDMYKEVNNSNHAATGINPILSGPNELFSFFKSVIEDIPPQLDAFKTTMSVDFAEAIGKPGEDGDGLKIIDVVSKLKEQYEKIYAWKKIANTCKYPKIASNVCKELISLIKVANKAFDDLQYCSTCSRFSIYDFYNRRIKEEEIQIIFDVNCTWSDEKLMEFFNEYSSMMLLDE